MSANDPTTIERKTSARMRILLIIWAWLCMSILLFALLAFLVLRPNEAGNQTMFWIFAGLSLLLVAISIPIKQKAITQALGEPDETKSAIRLQAGYITAWALCEAAGLLGIMARATTNSPYFYLLFILAELGMILNFPRREQVAAATFKNRF